MTEHPAAFAFRKPEDEPTRRPVYLRFWRTGEGPTDFTMDFGPETKESKQAFNDAWAAFRMLADRLGYSIEMVPLSQEEA